MNQFIKHYESKLSNTGSGIRQKNKRGCNVIFFNNIKQLLEKLELIIGEILAGYTSIEMRNIGVVILDTDTFLKASAFK